MAAPGTSFGRFIRHLGVRLSLIGVGTLVVFYSLLALGLTGWPMVAAAVGFFIGLLGVLWWARNRLSRTGGLRWPDEGFGRGLSLMWGVMGAVGVAILAASMLLSGGFALTHLQDHNEKVHVQYHAAVAPVGSGEYEVLLPAATHLEEYRIVAGEGTIELRETEYGEGLSLRSDGPVEIRGELEHRMQNHGFASYHPTLTDSEHDSPVVDSEKRYHVFVDHKDPVEVVVDVAVGYDCGTYKNSLRAVAEPGWSTHPGGWDHPHGDFCGLDALLFLPMGLGFGIYMVSPFFLLGFIGLSGVTLWSLSRGPGA